MMNEVVLKHSKPFLSTLLKKKKRIKDVPCLYVIHSVSENCVPVNKLLQQTHFVETTWRLETTIFSWLFRQVAEQRTELWVWFATSIQEDVGNKLLLTNRCCNAEPANEHCTEALKITLITKK